MFLVQPVREMIDDDFIAPAEMSFGSLGSAKPSGDHFACALPFYLVRLAPTSVLLAYDA